VLIYNLLTTGTVEEELLRISETKGALLEMFTSLEDEDESSIPLMPEPNIPSSPRKKRAPDIGIESVLSQSDLDLERRKNELLELVERSPNDGDVDLTTKPVDIQIKHAEPGISRPSDQPAGFSAVADQAILNEVITNPPAAQNVGHNTALESHCATYSHSDSVSDAKGAPSILSSPSNEEYRPESDPKDYTRNESALKSPSLVCEDSNQSFHDFNQDNGLDNSEITVQMGEVGLSESSPIQNGTPEGYMTPHVRSTAEQKGNLPATLPPSPFTNREEYSQDPPEDYDLSLYPQCDPKNEVISPFPSPECEADDLSSHGLNQDRAVDRSDPLMQLRDDASSEPSPIKGRVPEEFRSPHPRFTAEQKGKSRAIFSPSPSPVLLNEEDYPRDLLVDLDLSLAKAIQLEEDQQQAMDYQAGPVYSGKILSALREHHDLALARELQAEEDRQYAMTLEVENPRTAKPLPPIPGPSKVKDSLEELHAESSSLIPPSDTSKQGNKGESISQDTTSKDAAFARSTSELSNEVRISINIECTL
jgi:hypothetical protein